MTKRELADVVASETETTKSDAMKSVTVVFDTIAAALQDGTDIRIAGFGTFTVKQRNARTGRNPRTGETIEIPASTLPAFKPSKALKDRVNS